MLLRTLRMGGEVKRDDRHVDHADVVGTIHLKTTMYEKTLVECIPAILPSNECQRRRSSPSATESRCRQCLNVTCQTLGFVK